MDFGSQEMSMNSDISLNQYFFRNHLRNLTHCSTCRDPFFRNDRYFLNLDVLAALFSLRQFQA